jgi:putative RecB family exonuclease
MYLSTPTHSRTRRIRWSWSASSGTLHALWLAIQTATRNRDFRPSPSALCAWCDHHARCPAQGGTLPPFPEEVRAEDAVPAATASRHPDP